MSNAVTVEYLITMCERALSHLSSQKTAAEQLGDIARVSSLSDDIAKTEATLLRLRAPAPNP